MTITAAVTPPESPVRMSEHDLRDEWDKKGAFVNLALGASSDVSSLYAPVTDYEGYHRYDPKASWTPAEENAVRRKVDWRIMLWACVMFWALQLDRGNIKQAISDNMLPDLGMNTNDYNTGMTIFYVSFLCAELPSQLISKRLGADVWLPIQIGLWSVVTFCQFFLTDKKSFFLTRCLIGLLEGGFIPDMVLYLSYFYTSTELPVRLAFFWVASSFADICGSFLAYGLLRIHRGGNYGWQWLFMIEGLITLSIGLFSIVHLPASPTQTRSYWRPKGWFSEREETILVNRVLRDDPSKGDMHNRQGLTWRNLWDCLSDYDLWPIYILGLIVFIPPQPPAAYLTLTLKQLGFGTFKTNLLTIPSTIIHIILLLALTKASEIFNNRVWASIVTPIWCLICLVALLLLPSDEDKWVKYTISTLLVGYPYCHAILVAWTSRNANTVRTRAVGSAIYNMFVQAGSIIATNIYRDSDKPNYRHGNRALVGIAVLSIVLFVSSKAYYVWRNNTKAKIWDAWTEQEREHYLRTTADKGNKRLDFRFAH